MGTRREAAQRKLVGPKPRRFIALRQILIDLITFLLGALGISFFGLLLAIWGCGGEGLCIIEFWNTSGASLERQFSEVGGFVYVMFGIYLGIVFGFIAAAWINQKMDIIRPEELTRPAKRYGLFGLFRKVPPPPAITRHEMRN